MKKITLLSACITFFLHGYSQSFQGSGNALSFKQQTTNNQWQGVNLGSEVANQCRTIEFWFKPSVTINTSLSSAPVSLLVRNYNNISSTNISEFGIYFTPSAWDPANVGKLTFSRRIGSAIYIIYSDNSSWQANTNYHVACVMDPVSGMQMYINGVLQASTNPSTSPIETVTSPGSSDYDASVLGVWGYPGLTTGLRPFSGDMDELRFWTTARTGTEIKDNMCKKVATNTTGLKAYYNFDEANNSGSLDDATANHYNGTLLTNNTSAVYNLSKNWTASSAPVGDESSYLYNADLTGKTLTHNHNGGDNFTVSNISSASSAGVHIYRVNSLPNSVAGTQKPLNDYYGVFLTGNSGTYSISYNFSAYSNFCSAADLAYLSRTDNASATWADITASRNSCSYTKDNESSLSNSRPGAEYLLDNKTATGITEISAKNDLIEIYPNPNNGQFTIRLNKPFATDLYVYNSNGALVKNIPANEEIINIDLTNLPAGLYILKAQNGYLKKFIIQ